MENESFSNALTYLSDEPNVKALSSAYADTIKDLETYFDLCRNSYDDRRNHWPKKSRDLRKHGADAFPWDGSSDIEAHVIDERVTRLVSILMNSLNKANVKAFPVEMSDIARSKVVSNFMKWMTESGYIPRFKEEMERTANYMLERGIMINYVGWHSKDSRYLQKLDLNQIRQINPDLATAISYADNDAVTIEKMREAMPTITEKRAKKALKSLRKDGFADLPLVRRKVNAPRIETLAPDGDFFFPAYVTDPQRAPFCFWKTQYTAQELEGLILTEGWDENWVEHVIEKYRGVNIQTNERQQEGRRTNQLTKNTYEAQELIEVIYGFQRLIDPDDGAEGIYCTVFHREYTSDSDGARPYAKSELLNGYEDYPVEVTKLSEDNKRLYEAVTIPDLLRGIQNQVKVERDSRIDRNSLATLPPILHPTGNAPSDWGPGRNVPYRRKGEFEFAPVPQYNAGSVEMEETQLAQADRLVGLDEGSQFSAIRIQFLVDKFLTHCAKVLKLSYKCFQRFGPDQVFFRVTGVPDPQQFDKGNPDEDYDVTISFDMLNTDPDTQEKRLERLVSLVSMDRTGTIDVSELIGVAAMGIDPMVADRILIPKKDAQEKLKKDVTDDLSKIHAGIEISARPNGAQAALQIIQQYASQEDVAQELQENEAFAARLQKYAGQYQFAIQQQQNAQIGRIGTEPAQMGEVKTQGMNQ